MAANKESFQSKLDATKETVNKLKEKIKEIKLEKKSTNIGVVPKQDLKFNFDEWDGPKERRYLKGHYGKVYAMHWGSEKSNLLVSASQDGKLIIWDGITKMKANMIPLRSSWVMTCSFEQKSGNDKYVACGGLDNVCSIFDRDMFERSGDLAPQGGKHQLTQHDGYISCCRFVEEGKILTASGDSTCIHWDIENAKPITKFAEHGADVMSAAQSPTDPNMFASGSVDCTAKIWNLNQDQSCFTFGDFHTTDINSVSFFPGGNAFGTGSDDSTCRMFDIRCCGEIGQFFNESISCGITSVCFSKSGRLLFAGYEDNKCIAWDIANPGDNYQWDAHDNRVSCLGVTLDGKALCTGSWDNFLKIWI